MIFFCKQIIGNVTQANKKSYRYTIVEGGKETHKVYGVMFRRGEVSVGTIFRFSLI